MAQDKEKTIVNSFSDVLNKTEDSKQSMESTRLTDDEAFEIPTFLSDFSTSDESRPEIIDSSDTGTDSGKEMRKKKINILSNDVHTDSSSPFDSDGWIEVKMSDVIDDPNDPKVIKDNHRIREEKRRKEKRKRMSSKERRERDLLERGRREMERNIADLQLHAR